MLEGKIVEAVPPAKLVTTFIPRWGGEARETRVTYEIEPQGQVCKLTVTHENLTEAEGGIREGWAKIISGLKSYLETGEALPLAG